MKYLLVCLSVIFIGCSYEVKVPEKQYIPVKCKVSVTPKPILSNGKDELNYDKIFNDIVNIQIYSKILEKDLDFCIEGEVK